MTVNKVGIVPRLVCFVKRFGQSDDRDHQQQRISTHDGGHTPPSNELGEALSVGALPTKRRSHHAYDTAEQLGGVIAVEVVEPVFRDTEL